jgi:hypothetical protein
MAIDFSITLFFELRACIDVMLVASRDSEAALERLRRGVRFLPNGIDVSPMSPDGERNETVPTHCVRRHRL